MKIAALNFDGACEPKNPGGVATAGWILLGPDGEEIHSGSDVICEGLGATNNVAEYNALIKSLTWVERNIGELTSRGIEHLSVAGDSMLVVNQVLDKWRCNKLHLEKLRDHCRSLLDSLRNKGLTVKLEWVPRNMNELADELSRTAYEGHTGRPFPVRPR